MPGTSGFAYKSGKPIMWPNSWQNTLMSVMLLTPRCGTISETMKYGHDLPLWRTLARCGQ